MPASDDPVEFMTSDSLRQGPIKDAVSETVIQAGAIKRSSPVDSWSQYLSEETQNRILQAEADWNKFWKDILPQLQRKYGIDIETADPISKTPDLDQVSKWLEKLVEKNEGEGAKGFRGRMKHGIQKFTRCLGNNSKAIKAWLALLPQQSHYGSVICGGFQIFLTAACVAGDTKKEIVDILSAIPVIISGAEDQIEVYSEQPDVFSPMCDTFAKMCNTLLECFQWIYQWLADSQFKVAFRAVFKQDDYAVELRSSFETLNESIDTLQKQAIYGISKTTNKILAQNEALKSQINLMAEAQAKQGLSASKMEVNHSEVKQMMQNLLKQTGQANKLATVELMDEEDLQNVMTKSPRSLIVAAMAMKFFQARRRDIQSSKITADEDTDDQPALSQDSGKATPQTHREFLQLLNFDPDRPLTSLRKVEALGGLSDAREQERTRALLESLEVFRWLSSETSSSLFIDGNVNDPGGDNDCISVASSAIVSLLKGWDSNNIYVMYSFARYDSKYTGAFEGVRKMLIDFVGQLVYQDQQRLYLNTQDFDTIPLNNGSIDTTSICATLIELVRQLPASAKVVFVIDNIRSRIVQDKADLLAALQALTYLVADKHTIATVRLLVSNTATTISSDVRSCFKKTETMRLGDVDFDNSGFSVKTWKGPQAAKKGPAPVKGSKEVSQAQGPTPILFKRSAWPYQSDDEDIELKDDSDDD